MPVTSDPFSDLAAFQVFKMLDPMDHMEAELARGCDLTHLALFADWRAAEPVRVLSLVLSERRGSDKRPFAVLGLNRTSHAGVVEAAFLSRDHRVNRRAIAEAALLIRDGIKAFADQLGLHRIEARCWADHASASRFLVSLGFRHECDMPGYGVDGAVTFRLFAWVAPGSTTEGP